MIYLLHLPHFSCLNHVRNRTLTSNNFFDIYYFLNKDLYEINLVYSRNMVNFISLQVKKITIKVINDERQSFISKFYSYFFKLIMLITFNIIYSEQTITTQIQRW